MGASVQYYGRALLSHIITQLPPALKSSQHQAAPAWAWPRSCTRSPAPSSLRGSSTRSSLFARFTLAPPSRKSLSRGFVIRAIGDAAPPSWRTRHACTLVYRGPSDNLPSSVHPVTITLYPHAAGQMGPARRNFLYKALDVVALSSTAARGGACRAANPTTSGTQDAVLGRIDLHAPPPNLLLSHALVRPTWAPTAMISHTHTHPQTHTLHACPRRAQLRGDSSRCDRCSHW